MTAPAAMPSEEEIARAMRTARLKATSAAPMLIGYSGLAPAEDADLASARAILALFEKHFAPIMAENASLRETLRSNSVWDFPRDIQNLTVKLDAAESRALAAEAAIAAIKAKHAEWRKCMPDDWEGDPLSHAIEAAAIRAQGE